MNIYQSAEDYLETILKLSLTYDNVRSIDIAKDMNFSKSSVSIAIKKLKTKKFILVDDITGYITLTEAGKEIASKIFNRHKVLKEILLKIGISLESADKDACAIEHEISNETFIALEKLNKKLQ